MAEQWPELTIFRWDSALPQPEFGVTREPSEEYQHAETYVPRAALQAVEAERETWRRVAERLQSEDFELRDRADRAEQAEKQLEELEAERDRRLADAEFIRVTETRKLRKERDDAEEQLESGEEGWLERSLNRTKENIAARPNHLKPARYRQPDTASEAPRCEHVFRMSSYGRCIKCGIQGNPMGGREDR